MRRALMLSALVLVVFGFAAIAQANSVNLALGGTASQSSTLVQGPTFSANYAIDGHTGGDYAFSGIMITHTAGTETSNNPPWWQVDLGKTDQLNDIVIWGRTDGGHAAFGHLSNFTVSILDHNDNLVWNQHYDSFTETTTAGTLNENSSGMAISLGTGVSGEIVKIQNGWGSGNGYLALAEVQVLGQNSTVPEPCTMLLFGSGLAGLAAFRKKSRA